MSIATRALIGIGALGGIGGVGYALHRQLSTDNIGKKLVANRYQILENSSNDWVAILESYKATVSGVDGNTKLKLGNFDGTQTDGKAKERLQKECQIILGKSTENKEDYEKAKKWCTVPKSLKNLLTDDGYRVLGTKEDDDNVDKDDWDKKITEHNKKNENKGERFSNLGGTKDEDVKQDPTGRKTIKKKCKELEDKKHHEKEIEAHLDKAKLWCAVKIND